MAATGPGGRPLTGRTALKGMFPGMDQEVISDIYAANGGDLGGSVDHLLLMGDGPGGGGGGGAGGVAQPKFVAPLPQRPETGRTSLNKMFPQFDRDTLGNVLNMNNGSVESSVDYLLTNHPTAAKASEDDVYEGFSTRPREANPEDPYDFGQATQKPPTTGMQQMASRQQRAGAPPTRMDTAQRTLTSSYQDAGPPPKTSVSSTRAANYSSKPQRTNGLFDPLSQTAGKGPPPPLEKKNSDTPEEQAKQIEKQVNKLIEESAFANLEKDYSLALDKAKEASRKERALCKLREQGGQTDNINIDLTYSVCFNLAVQYHAAGMYTEALNTYSAIVKNKQYAQSGRLRANMGNIYFEQKKYPSAIKMYRMALDQVPNTGKEIRFQISRNIGNAFVRLGHYQEAMLSFESIMEGQEQPDIRTGFNLLVCYYALGDKEKMKKCFTRLLNCRELHLLADGDGDDDEGKGKDDPSTLVDDSLKIEIRNRKARARRYIAMGANLIAPVIEKTLVDGFDCVVQMLRMKSQSSLASELEISKALSYLRNMDFAKAIETLKSFEKQDRDLASRAATNLSYLYFLESDFKNAEKYADVAVQTDRYNAKSLVNKANCLYHKQEYAKSKAMYIEALQVEVDCTEALFNLGLVNKKLQLYPEALESFEKLDGLQTNNPEVYYHIADIFELMGNNAQALKWFENLVALVPTDPGLLARLGSLHSRLDDESQAYHFHLESYRFYPVNMDVISWLGAYFVKNEFYEKAIQFFERATQIQPGEVKWQLMIASCYRRIGAYPRALHIYQDIHERFPQNLECLRFLDRICKDLGMAKEEADYSAKLRKAQRMEETRREQEQTAPDPAEHEHQEYQQPYEQEDSGRKSVSGGGGGGGGFDASATQMVGVNLDSPDKKGFIRAQTNAKVAAEDDDEWAGQDVDDLLPL